MSEHEIKVADIILNYGSLNKDMPLNYCAKFPKNADIPDAVLNYVGKYLEDSGHIKLTKNGDEYLYRLESTGHDLARFKKSYSDYLMKEAEKEAKEKDKEERDEYYKTLQVRDLEEKLEVMNVEQRKFWDGQAERNTQLTLLGILTFLISAIALSKSFGFCD